ncbi:MAG: hypothetical protein ACOVP4_08115 [Bacteriovoracaceae bacterium]
MKILLMVTLMIFSVAQAQELKLGDYYKAEEISSLLKNKYPKLQNPNCLKEYLLSSDYKSRMKDGAQIRNVNVCSRGREMRVNIHFNQMGGTQGSIGAMNTIVYCLLKVPVAPAGCSYDY